MKPVLSKFVPLSVGELPGDPDMGGWRPLTGETLSLLLGNVPQQEPNQFSTKSASGETSLILLMQLIGYQMTYFRMWQAVQTVGYQLSWHSDRPKSTNGDEPHDDRNNN